MARLLLRLALILLAGPACAVTLDFSGLPSGAWQGERMEGGVTISGATVGDDGVARGTASVDSMRHRGLGALSSGETADMPGATFLDSHGARDAIVFDFGHDVQLESIGLAMADWLDRFDLYIGAELAYAGTFKAGDLNGASWLSTIGLADGLIGSTFAIGAAAYEVCGYDAVTGIDCWTQGSSFRITTIEFSDMAPIPAPAGWALMLTAISAVAGARMLRRRPTSKA